MVAAAMVIAEGSAPISSAGGVMRWMRRAKWQRGSFLDSCEATFGEDFSVTQFVELSDKNYNTTITCLNTYKAFRTRRYRLSFTHHKEALYSKFPGLEDNERHDLMHRLMEISERFNLTCAEQRKLFSYARNFGAAAVGEIEDELADTDAHIDEERANGRIVDRDQLVDRVTTRDANRNYLFRYQNRLYHYRGVRDALPRGATSIVCTDDWRQFTAGGQESAVPQWERPGEVAEEGA